MEGKFETAFLLPIFDDESIDDRNREEVILARTPQIVQVRPVYTAERNQEWTAVGDSIQQSALHADSSLAELKSYQRVRESLNSSWTLADAL